MISDWLSDEGRKAIEKASLADQGEVDYMIASYALDNDHDRILALLRDRAREWLEGRGAYVRPTNKDELGRYYICVKNLSGPPCRNDYDAALIVAVLAMEPK